MQQRGSSGAEEPQTAGYKFINSDEVKAFCANPTGGKRVGVEVKAVISGDITDTMGAAGDLVVPDRGPMLMPPQRRMTVRDLITPGRTSSSSHPVSAGNPVYQRGRHRCGNRVGDQAAV